MLVGVHERIRIQYLDANVFRPTEAMAGSYDPQIVGSHFVKQYYTQLHKDPVQLHRFYLDQSSYVHGSSEIGSEEPVVGQKVNVCI